MEEPFFGLTATINCTKAYETCKKSGVSFFLFYLHKALIAANRIDSFKLKIVDDEVWVFDKINATPTISRIDGTFGFSYIEFSEDFKEFSEKAIEIIEIIKKHNGLFPPPELEVFEHVIQFSAIPWVDFTSLSHARSFAYKDSSPKISFGKLTDKNGEKLMPVSVHVHHSLMDGFHVGQFFEFFQEELDF